MYPIGHHYYVAAHARRRLDPLTNATKVLPARSVADKAHRDRALGVLLITTITAVPILLTAIFMLLFKF